MINKIFKFRGGVVLDHKKSTADSPVENFPLPKTIEIFMQQHIGAPCLPLVKKGDYVYVGQKVGDSEAFVSAPIHSGVSGQVKEIKDVILYNGTKSKSIVIEADGKQEVLPDLKIPDISSKELFLQAIRDCGMTGLGGAGFPTHVKLNTRDRIPEFLVINAVECEPFITCDYRAVLERSKEIFQGIQLCLDKLSIPKAIIGIEDDKMPAAEILKDLCKSDSRIETLVLKTKYPQGAEKMLIYALTGRKVPMGGLPIDIGVVVMNITTVMMINNYIKSGMPLVSRIVTIDGEGIEKKGNYEIIFGTSIRDIYDYCKKEDGSEEDVTKILYGGPMNGLTVRDFDRPLLKQNNAILFMTKKELNLEKESACIRCGRCVENCPMSLMPLMMNKYALLEDIEQLEKLNISNCIECGVCSYVCPAKRHLVQSFKMGKELLRKERSKNG